MIGTTMSVEQNAELIVTLANEIRTAARHSVEKDFKKNEAENTLIIPAAGRAIEQISKDELAKRTDQLSRDRRYRDNTFNNAALFADPAWDLLLDLFSAHLGGWKISVTNACLAAHVPPTTALRWIDTLIEVGLAERVGDASDLRRKFIRLTPDAIAKLTKVLSEPPART